MPELPEVETTRRGLQAAVLGARITQVTVRRHDLRMPIPKRLAGALKGTRITDVRRRAKYLLIDLDSGETLLIHLGMSGSMRIEKAAKYVPKTHDHVMFSLETGVLAVLHDPRRFGLIDLLKPGQEAIHPLLAHLGPEPLSKDFSAAYLAKQLARCSGPIKPALMDQKRVVGVGNIYASECLHLAGIHPQEPAKNVVKQSDKIIAAIRKTLKAAIESGGSSLRDYVGAGGEGGYFQHKFLVYGRDGQPCFRCGTLIENGVQSGRASYWCPQCQPLRGFRRKT